LKSFVILKLLGLQIKIYYYFFTTGKGCATPWLMQKKCRKAMIFKEKKSAELKKNCVF